MLNQSFGTYALLSLSCSLPSSLKRETYSLCCTHFIFLQTPEMPTPTTVPCQVSDSYRYSIIAYWSLTIMLSDSIGQERPSEVGLMPSSKRQFTSRPASITLARSSTRNSWKTESTWSVFPHDQRVFPLHHVISTSPSMTIWSISDQASRECSHVLFFVLGSQRDRCPEEGLKRP